MGQRLAATLILLDRKRSANLVASGLRSGASVAEGAASAIGADALLTRVGAYYHDLGKTTQPKYFVENLGPDPTRRRRRRGVRFRAAGNRCPSLPFSPMSGPIAIRDRQNSPHLVWSAAHRREGALRESWRKAAKGGERRKETRGNQAWFAGESRSYRENCGTLQDHLMHDLFRLEETLPEGPGTSPFRVRGVWYERVLEHAKTMPGGVAHFLDDLLEPRVRDFMRQQFQFMNWYDALPMMPCAVTMARLCDQPFEAYVRERARMSMVRLIPSMFRIFSRLGGPRLAAPHAPRLFKSYFDFVEVRVWRVSDESGTGTVAGVPLYLAPVLANQVLGIIGGALESLGASGIEARYRDVTVTSPVHGFSAVTFHGDFAWHLEEAVKTA